MAETITESQLTTRSISSIRFALARVEDDAAIRRLLRRNPMRGEISVSFEREPNYFYSTDIAGADDQTILAYNDERLVSMGRYSIRDRYVNGQVSRVGYLSDLRLDSSVQGRFDILRRGYQFLRELQDNNPADFYFTSITADNVRSIRFLERGLPGMPLYRPLADFVTLLVPVPRHLQSLQRRKEKILSRVRSEGIEVVSGSDCYIDQLIEFLNLNAERYQLAVRWDEEKLLSLRHSGLATSDFQIFISAGRVIGCAALWDQRHFKQTVICGYSRRLSLFQPFVNFGARMFGSPRLPDIRSTLAHGFLSPIAIDLGKEQYLPALIDLSLLTAANRGLEFLTLGFSDSDPRLAFVRNKFRCREYNSRFFQVLWGGKNSKAPALNDNLFFPEVALL